MNIAVLVSGGVDSSVSLRLLKDAGHDVTAFYLKIWLEDELSHLNACPWQEDLDFIREVCRSCDTKLEVVSMQTAYYNRVVEHTIAEAAAGRTPNPDIWCNSRIKFGLFLEQFPDFDKVASGHYAQVKADDGQFCLYQSPDPVKDQTYFLAQLNAALLPKLMFPIGHLFKSEVRKLASDFSLVNATRKDSQGICFLGKFKYRDFLAHYLGTKTGPILEFETKEKIGDHEGHWFYTKGQRKGIKLGQGPWYVVEKDVHQNIVYVSKQYFDDHHHRKSFSVDKVNWYKLPKDPANLQLKLRHGPNFSSGSMDLTTNQIQLETNDLGLASGQLAAFYEDGWCLGSGVIV